MIRVLQVVTDMNRGGIETMLMNYYRHIDRDRVQFDFLTHRPYGGDYGREIYELGGRIYHLPRLNPFSLNYRRELRRFFREHPQYTIIHVHPDCMSSLVMKIAEEEGIPVRIAHSHNSEQEYNYKYPIKMYYRNQIPQYATELMACSKKAGDWMFGNIEYKIAPNAIDAKHFEYDVKKRDKIRKEYGFDDDLVIGHTGRFEKQKNHIFLIEVFAEINKRRPSRMVMIGDGRLKGEIARKIDAMGLKERTIFAGVRDDVNEMLQAMDVFVFPSLFEGLPLSLIEAQAAGLPCYASDAVSAESSISDIVTRLPLSIGADAWAEKIVMTDRTKRKPMSDEIKRAGYDIGNNAKELQEFYLSCVNGILK